MTQQERSIVVTVEPSAGSSAIAKSSGTRSSVEQSAASSAVAKAQPGNRRHDRRSVAAKAVDRERNKKQVTWCFRIHDVEHGWKLFIFWACLFCLVWIVITSFAPMPYGLLQRYYDMNSTAWSWGLSPRETVTALEWYTLVLLAVSRSSAYGAHRGLNRPSVRGKNGSQSNRALDSHLPTDDDPFPF